MTKAPALHIERVALFVPLIARKATRVVIGGNGTLRVLRDLGWKRADVVFVDVTEEEAQLLSLRLNRSAELAEWDFEVLSEIFSGLGEKSSSEWLALGWLPQEAKAISDFKNLTLSFREVADAEQGSGQRTHVCPKCGFEF